MAEFTGRVRQLISETVGKNKKIETYLIIGDNDQKSGFGEIRLVLTPGMAGFCLGNVVTVFFHSVKVSAPNIKKNGVVRLSDPETFLNFL